ncbi:hypothetical protein EIN_251820 [Entamoeba invadens IP1]|uniref:Ras modification protein ERF4 n=1 Tax=Entamoeba invadens IP1 TaxID=370355 RepID=A0A0A1UEU2_ENTIV|nr:hypothetical protein EIN_251820 [Entamoeba invadens IP1]ELP94998.1 hypothetical protein EIN_251820 [Entamoeba invadens IP1]|eukprot:XP_004261769.1 hypothetical protein EIN_251820 [Entamoeba invadens IP1]
MAHPTVHYQIVSVDRDYSKGLTPQFYVQRPPALSGHIEPYDFEEVMKRVNKFFEQAETITWKTMLEESLSCFTCGLTECCIKNQYYRRMCELQEYLTELNIRFPSLQFIHPINNGFLCVCSSLLIIEQID